MPKYRNALSQLGNTIFLTDGGMETSLIFHDGVDLPHFASFVLLDSQEGRRRLTDYYDRYVAIARERRVGFILDSATWRANADWGALLGYSADALKQVNTSAITLLTELRARWEAPETPCIVSGAIGPRGDGYKAGKMDAAEAAAYHDAQVEAFAETDADMVSAFTLTNVDEAIGIARAARRHALPCAISFTVETNGRLVTGRTLRDAIETVDRETDGYPVHYLVNCAHPTHFAPALEAGEAWMERVRGIRANASAKSHAELDEADTLDAGDPVELGRLYAQLSVRFPTLRILGGCCGTDHRHIGAIAEACLPAVRSTG